ncbi:hypothetical protein PFICI_13313 [Pestalotiopsis fici W106-1]|uniref:Glycosyl hydrolase n=1 Tax=Pestalotiopsis fici (strain W106-1 / CGMCC3.15140) TaxID=1229662 RepID=W3WM45_PESFW|nr:uncharacterized protein PFICI_13313 [Pestalotiopsis fici W106-1]ETS74829.1 hypothetical protein PFICI_13313 [Pestalotiopsis fici W106-1]
MFLCRGFSSLGLAAASLLFYTLLPLGASAVIREAECTVSSIEGRSCTQSTPQGFIPENVAERTWRKTFPEPDLDVLSELLDSIGVMQDDYFAPWLGTWPTSIDWTGAVMGTHVSGTLRSFTAALDAVRSSGDPVEDWKLKENLIENYFTQVVSYYFGENDFEIRMEAYDDILWVVLGWLEAVRFVREHTALHYQLETQRKGLDSQSTGSVGEILRNQTWHGNLWIPAFSHRARVFWDLAAKGWDTELCGGGMTWNPRLLPYKNAITNELFIAGSISMYLYFPGDDNTAPFSQARTSRDAQGTEARQQVARDPKYLQAAVDGYKWLVNSNMTDTQGLFTDGFHISGYANPASNNTKCDERNDMVFTYNQGVVLTGQRGLWDATGALSYLLEGHLLIQNVINATGYDLKRDQPRDDYKTLAPDTVPQWYGLGRLGVIEDNCDASGTCSQDGQTFKGIFFHHLTYFCAPLSLPPPDLGREVDHDAFAAAQKSHTEACLSYAGWLRWNAEAALNTRDAAGKFGMWFTAGLLTNLTSAAWPTVADQHVAGVDYRNYGVPNDTTWQRPGDILDPGAKMPVGIPILPADESRQQPIDGAAAPRQALGVDEKVERESLADDPNNRGRGRTVETQGSGLALIRAYWSITQLRD